MLDIARRLRGVDAERAGPERAERRYQAVVRCDLGGEPAKRVAADLGISIRQLRRERSYAHVRIEEQLRCRSTPTRAIVLPDAVGLELDLARRLAESGRAAAATEVLQSLARDVIPLERRVEVMAILAEVLLDRDKLEEARSVIRAASQIVPEGGAGSLAPWRERLALPEAVLDFRSGNTTHGLQREDAILQTLAGASDSDSAAAAIVATILVDRAWRAANRGSWSSARESVDRVGSMALRPGAVAQVTIIDALILESHIALSQTEDLNRASRSATRALEMAQHEGLGIRAAVAGAQLADVQFRLGLRAEGLATARASVEVARRVGAPTILAGAALGAANLELRSNAADAAVPHLQTAAAAITEGSSYWARLQLGWADVFMQRGAVETALWHARAAGSAAERLGNGRLQGAALRRCAQMEHDLGKDRIAARTIKSAIALLEKHGTRYALALGYEVSFRVTGAVTHLNLARELVPPSAGQADKKRPSSAIRR